MKVILRSLATALLLAALVLTFTIRVAAPGLPRVVGAPEVERVQRFSWNDVNQLRLANLNGRVRVVTQPGSQADAEAYLRIYGLKRGLEQAARDCAASLFTVAQEGGLVSLATEPNPLPDALDIYVDYIVRVPEGADVDIQNGSGNVSVSRGVGGVHIAACNADITVQEPQGQTHIQTLNGRIRLDGARADATLNTVNGNVYVYMQGGGLDAETTNGAVVAHLLAPDAAPCRLTSRNGGITVALQEGVSAQINARTDFGEIRCDLPLDASSGEGKRRTLMGRIGEGQRALELTALNGNIWITREHSRNATAGKVVQDSLNPGVGP